MATRRKSSWKHGRFSPTRWWNGSPRRPLPRAPPTRTWGRPPGARGLSEFTIEYGSPRPLQLRIGRLLVRDLYVRLTTIFEQPTRFVWSLEWRFIRNLMLSFSVDNAGGSDALLRYTIRF